MLNVGVIGCGGMGKDHIKRLTNKIQGANVVAVSDVFEEGAKEAAALVLHIQILYYRQLKREKEFSVKSHWQQLQRTVKRLWMQNPLQESI